MKISTLLLAGLALVAAIPPALGQTVQDPQWGFSFQVPAGWKHQYDAAGALLGHETIPGMLLVLPHTVGTIQELESLMQQGLEEEGITLMLAGQISPAGKNMLSSTYSGEYQGQQVQAKGYGLLSPQGGGAYVIALCTPENYGKKLEAAAEALVRSVRYPKPDGKSGGSGIAANLVGTWVTMTKSTETTVTLAADGNFYTNYVAGYSGTESGQWGLAREDKSAGRWLVRGSREQGVVVLRYANGKEETIQYKVHREGGEVYWNEYWFNGDLYGRK